MTQPNYGINDNNVEETEGYELQELQVFVKKGVHANYRG